MTDMRHPETVAVAEVLAEKHSTVSSPLQVLWSMSAERRAVLFAEAERIVERLRVDGHLR